MDGPILSLPQVAGLLASCSDCASADMEPARPSSVIFALCFRVSVSFVARAQPAQVHMIVKGALPSAIGGALHEQFLVRLPSEMGCHGAR